MTHKLILRPEAENELQDGFGWYELQVPGLGSQFLIAVDATINSIRRHPLQYPIVHKNIRRALIRRFPFQVLYVYDNDAIVVIAIFHGKRNPKSWQQRD
jgi:plasmid stabilization system protein ParE